MGDLSGRFQVRFLPVDLESKAVERVSNLGNDPQRGRFGLGQEQEVVDVARATDSKLHAHVGLDGARHLGERQGGMGETETEHQTLVPDWLAIGTRGFELEILPVFGMDLNVKEGVGKVH